MANRQAPIAGIVPATGATPVFGAGDRVRTKHNVRIPPVLSAVAILFAMANSAGAQSMVYGMGTVACADYSGFKAQNHNMYSAAQAWTTGYLTAMTQQLKIDDLLHGVDINGAMAWLDDYCAKNSLETYFTANSHLVTYLARRQGQGN